MATDLRDRQRDSAVIDPFRIVDPHEIPESWPTIWPVLARAVERGDGTFVERDILMALLAGQWKLAVAETQNQIVALCTLEIVDFPRMRKCIIRYAAGKGDVFLSALGQLAGWAEALNCTRIEAYGRKGWPRFLPGWRQDYVVFHKELGHGRS